MKIIAYRVYDKALPSGYHVLVDRLWPRGISKQEASWDEWCKDIAPSPALRKWFGHEEKKWPEFRKKYLHELADNREVASALLGRADRKNLMLLYGAKDIHHNHALVLKEFLEALLHDDEPKEYASPPCFAHELKE